MHREEINQDEYRRLPLKFESEKWHLATLKFRHQWGRSLTHQIP